MSKVERIFLLDEILEIIEIKKNNDKMFDNLDRMFDENIFEMDYILLHKIRQKIGEIGEKFVFEREKNKLLSKNSCYAEKIDDSPAKDPNNGYDILSYTEEGVPIYIEVKSTTGDLYTPFYLTKHEKEVAEAIRKNKKGLYQIHRVFNVGKQMDVCVYDDENEFVYESEIYRVSIKR